MKHQKASWTASEWSGEGRLSPVRAATLDDRALSVAPHQLAETIERSFRVDRTDRHYPPAVRGLLLFGLPIAAWSVIIAGVHML